MAELTIEDIVVGRARTSTGSRKAAAGFSLVELLIVIVVMGILVTIVLPRFTQSRDKAYDAAAKTDLRNAMTAQEGYFADNQSYTTDAGTSGLNVVSSSQVTLAIPSAGATSYMMTAKHASSASTYCVNSDDGEIVSGTSC
ncbi:hypothetical protein BH18GEM1_BH18GEM1_11930 [soil metagenome]